MTVELVDLLRESRQRGFLGPGPVESHLDHARAFAVVAPAPPRRALDLGAGGGLPGLVLASEVWPDTEWTFLDAQLRRTEFLAEAVELLGLSDRVSVRMERAELTGRDAGHRAAFDLVVSRSFGPPAVAAECAAPLLRVGGSLVVSEPPEAVLSERWPAPAVGVLGLADGSPRVVGGSAGFHFMRLDQVEPCPERFPRRVGIPGKRPLF